MEGEEEEEALCEVETFWPVVYFTMCFVVVYCCLAGIHFVN